MTDGEEKKGAEEEMVVVGVGEGMEKGIKGE